MHFGEKSRKTIRTGLLWAATALIGTGIVEVARVPLAYLEASMGARTALHKPFVPVQPVPAAAKVTVVSDNALYPKAAPASQPLAAGALLGRLSIQNLGLEAPVTQGTALDILAHSAGHLTTSALPGQVGTAVIAAHDVTYFHHIDQLQPGDEIRIHTAQGTFWYAVVSHKVIRVGTSVVNTAYPSLMLETCYPLNALNLVNQRYVVMAVLVKSHLASHAQPAGNGTI
ncbi:class D sortase [Alicyclobacillus tolerans]|uniref:class D sortase n=1 Tax=Alicyclobacillus tolerans TaxID=90970 RepID=UPI001F20A245|nr:class D sortase [Alicyclobacillus tolerans]MCF8568442.1 class D sortase [Alicyclobacillus tolerans]